MPNEIPFNTLFNSRTRKINKEGPLFPKLIQGERTGLLVLDSNGKVLFANNTALEFLQKPMEKIMGETIQEFVSLINNNSSETHRYLKNSDRSIEVGVSSMRIDGVEINFISMLDITNLETIEDALHNSEDRLNLAIDATGLGFWDYDFENNETTVNSNYASMLGFKIDEFIDPGMWVRLVHPSDMDYVWDVWNKHIEENTSEYYVEYRTLTKSGDWKWVLARGQVKGKTKEGGPKHFIGTHQDVTRQKLADQELKLLYHITSISSEFTPASERISKILDIFQRVTKIPASSVHLLNDDAKSFNLISFLGFPENTTYEKMKVFNKTISSVVIDGKPLVKKTTYAQKQLKMSMLAAIPILLHDQIIGVLTGYWFKPQPVTNLDLHLLDVAAKQLGNALERDRLRNAAENAILIEERQRLARELHDSLSQSLYSLALMADGGVDYARLGESTRSEQIFQQIGDQVLQALKEMRLLVYELRPTMLEEKGLVGALRSRLSMVEKRAMIETVFTVNSQITLSKTIEAGLYGIAQEILNNVLKHSGARKVEVSLSVIDENVILKIEDNGQGFNTNTDMGVGLISIRERAERLGGIVSLTSFIGEGTIVQIKVPISENNPDKNLNESGKNQV